MYPDKSTQHIELEEGGLRVPDAETADYINKYFSTIGKVLYEELGAQNQHQQQPAQPQLDGDHAAQNEDTEDNFALNDLINEETVRPLVLSINTDKSSGLTAINSKVLKDALLLLVGHLVTIFKNSLPEGIFPDSWATGILVPIPKKGDLHNIKNWRPITLLPLPGKYLRK